MLVGLVLTLVMLVVVWQVAKLSCVPGRDDDVVSLMVGGYVLRMVIQLFVRNLELFSHGGGGDYVIYEHHAANILRLWSSTGITYVTDEDYPYLGATSLPPNLFAFIMNLNGGDPTPMGCTSVIAALGCFACLILYRLAVDLGAEPRRSRLLMTALLFSPAYLLYTSDMYKDGLVIFFAVAAVANGIRLAGGFSFVRILSIGVCLLALGLVRSYLVYVIVAPLVVGLLGFRSRSAARPLLAVLALGAAFIVIVSSTDALETVRESADQTFQRGTARNVLDANAGVGSGVTFDDGGNPWGALGPKLLYMVFSPFPWSGGSVGFQIGKLDTFIWYFILYRIWKASSELWKNQRTTFLMLLGFIVPMTVTYATSFANVGLSLRQRLVIVFLASLLAMLSWPAEDTFAEANEPEPEPAPPTRARAHLTT